MRLRELLKEQNVNQRNVAAAVGISPAAFSHYVKGEREPDFDTLIKLADYFNVSVDYLLGRDYQDTSQKENYQNGNLIAVTEDESILITYYRRLTQSDKLIIFNMLKSVFKPAYDLPIEQVSLYLGVLN